MGEAVLGSIAGGVASSVVGKALGGGKTAPSQAPVKVEGADFQPFTYTGGSGFGVTGTPEGDYGYGYDTTLPSWVTDMGATGAAAADPLLQKYLEKLQGEDAYSAADEFYKRGLAQIQPEIDKARVQLGEGLFGSGRLGLKIAGEGAGYGAGAGAINPEIAGFGAGTTKALSDLYTQSLSKGAQLRADELSQLQEGYKTMVSAGLSPFEIEKGLMKLAADLEGARASAMKAGTSFVPLGETSQSLFAGLTGQAVGSAVNDYFNPSNAVPQGYTGSWQNPDNFYSSGPSLFSGAPNVTSVYSPNAFAVGGGNAFWS